MSNTTVNGNEPVHVLVEGLGKASGVYHNSGLSDGVAKYIMEVKRQGSFAESTIESFQLSRRNSENDHGAKIWRIEQTSASFYIGRMYGEAPMCLEDPNYPPSKGWTPANGMEAPELIRVTAMTARKQQSASIYKAILFSEEYSDATILCEDEVAIPVHKNILAASSPYFKAAFNGDWEENQSGVIKTSYPAHVIKETLSLIYTGYSTTNLIQEAPLAFISVASEFDLPWLKTLAEPICVESLDENNLKAMWQSSRLYESKPLKTACVKYAKRNAVAVLTNSAVIDLKSEDPESWEEFVEAVAAS